MQCWLSMQSSQSVIPVRYIMKNDHQLSRLLLALELYSDYCYMQLQLLLLYRMWQYSNNMPLYMNLITRNLFWWSSAFISSSNSRLSIWFTEAAVREGCRCKEPNSDEYLYAFKKSCYGYQTTYFDANGDEHAGPIKACPAGLYFNLDKCSCDYDKSSGDFPCCLD